VLPPVPHPPPRLRNIRTIRRKGSVNIGEKNPTQVSKRDLRAIREFARRPVKPSERASLTARRPATLSGASRRPSTRSRPAASSSAQRGARGGRCDSSSGATGHQVAPVASCSQCGQPAPCSRSLTRRAIGTDSGGIGIIACSRRAQRLYPSRKARVRRALHCRRRCVAGDRGNEAVRASRCRPCCSSAGVHLPRHGGRTTASVVYRRHRPNPPRARPSSTPRPSVAMTGHCHGRR